MSVEFLEGDDTPPASEDRPRQQRRTRWLLGLVVVVALGVLVVIVRQSGGAARPRPHVLVLPRPSPATSSSGASSGAAGVCGAAPSCQATVEEPEGLRTALRTHVAGTIVALRVRSYLAQTLATGALYLVERDIDITTSTTAEVLIRVHRVLGASAPPRVIITAGPGLGSVLLRGTGNSTYDVDLQYVAPETVAPSVDTLQALADDPVLASL